jgi:hypothetical protein
VLAASARLAEAGVWNALHHKLLVKLNAAGAIDWSRAAVDGSRVVPFWGLLTFPWVV